MIILKFMTRLFKGFIRCKAILLILFINLCLLIGFNGCKNQGIPTEAVILARTPVTVASITHKSISETLEFPAVSIFTRKNTIRSSTTGIVESISAEPGEFVRKGQLIFTVKTLEASAIGKSKPADTSLVLKGLINIYSPKDGVILTISHQNSDFIQEGDELAVLSDQGSLVFSLETPFELRKYIEKTRLCYLRLPDSTLIKGDILGRMPEMNTVSQTVSYYVKPVSSERLPQNLMATAIVNKTTRLNAQVLPRTAILGDETQTEFWVMKAINDSTAVKIPVIKGIENYNDVEITDPVFLPEDKIIVTGNYGLADTAAIIIVK